MERIDLEAPVQARPGTTVFQPASLTLDWKGGAIVLNLDGANGVSATAVWSDAAGEDATGMMRALNKANLSTKSLVRRAMERALADGKIPAGTISGTPD